MNFTVKHIYGDLSIDDFKFIVNHHLPISIDTETTGLDARIHNLKLIQIGLGDIVYIIRYNLGSNYPNFTKLVNSGKLIYFHNAIFDIKFLIKNIPSLQFVNIRCTKITAKVINGPLKTSSLKPLLEHFCNIKIDKSQQTSNWSDNNYTQAQIEYAARDVLYLPLLFSQMEPIINDRNIYPILLKCFEFVPIQAYLELFSIDNVFKY